MVLKAERQSKKLVEMELSWKEEVGELRAEVRAAVSAVNVSAAEHRRQHEKTLERLRRANGLAAEAKRYTNEEMEKVADRIVNLEAAVEDTTQATDEVTET
eukprot:SAG31_NODE_1274_length_9050_cov_10.910178_12_plen_100_part_01